MNQQAQFADLRQMTANPLALTQGAFLGKMRIADEGEDELIPAVQIGSGQTPVSNGLSEGYSTADIAHFYIAKELGPSWFAHLMVAFKEFCHDVQFEERYAGPEMFCCNHLKEGGSND